MNPKIDQKSSKNRRDCGWGSKLCVTKNSSPVCFSCCTVCRLKQSDRPGRWFPDFCRWFFLDWVRSLKQVEFMVGKEGATCEILKLVDLSWIVELVGGDVHAFFLWYRHFLVHKWYSMILLPFTNWVMTYATKPTLYQKRKAFFAHTWTALCIYLTWYYGDFLPCYTISQISSHDIMS